MLGPSNLYAVIWKLLLLEHARFAGAYPDRFVSRRDSHRHRDQYSQGTCPRESFGGQSSLEARLTAEGADPGNAGTSEPGGPKAAECRCALSTSARGGAGTPARAMIATTVSGLRVWTSHDSQCPAAWRAPSLGRGWPADYQFMNRKCGPAVGYRDDGAGLTAARLAAPPLKLMCSTVCPWRKIVSRAAHCHTRA